VVSRPLTIVTWLPALTWVLVWVTPLPCSLPLPLLTLAETLMNRKKVSAWLKVLSGRAEPGVGDAGYHKVVSVAAGKGNPGLDGRDLSS